jgi:hypothetical protein
VNTKPSAPKALRRRREKELGVSWFENSAFFKSALPKTKTLKNFLLSEIG